MLLICLLVGLQSSYIQTILTQKASAYFSEKLNAKVKIDKVDIDFFNTIVFEGFRIEDLHHNNLLSADKLKASISSFDGEKKIIEIEKIKFDELDFSLVYYKNESDNNLEFIIDAFSSTDTSAKNMDWKFKFNKIELVNSRFKLKNENYLDQTISYFGVNYDDLDVNNLNLQIENVVLSTDTIFGDIVSMNFKEKSGFFLSDFSSKSYVCDKELRFKDLKIKTPVTGINSQLSFHYKKYSDFFDFNNKVFMKSTFSSSKVNFKDISYFAPYLEGIDNEMFLTGNINGTINKLKGHNIRITTGKNTLIKGNFDLNGLPNIEETYMQIDLNQLTTNRQDLKQIPLSPFKNKEHLEIPENISQLGLIRFSGNFTGFYDDFVALGNFQTNLGKISSDIELKYDEKSKHTFYDGSVKLTNFDLGKYFDIKDLGAVSLNANVKGKGFTKEELDASVEGNINSLQYNRYVYTDTKIKGHLANKLFQGDLNANDPNLKLDFEGEINFLNELPEFKFVSNIHSAKFSALNFISRDTSSLFSSNLLLDFKGNNLDNLEGIISLKDLSYSEKNKNYKIKNIKLEALELGNIKSIKLNSDNLDAEINGNFDLADLSNSIINQFDKVLLPPKEIKSKKQQKNIFQNFNYQIYIKNAEPITDLFLTGFKIANNSSFSGFYNSEQESFELIGQANEIGIYGNKLKNISIKSIGNKSILDLTIKANSFQLNDSLSIENLNISADTKKDSLNFSLTWDDNKKIKNKADIKGYVSFKTLSNFNLKLLPSEIYFSDSLWSISEDNLIAVDSTSIKIESVEFKNLKQSVQVQGIISEQSGNGLLIGFEEFKLENFNPLLNRSGINIKGIINGQAKLSDLYKNTGFRTGLNFSSFHFNGDNLGDGSIISSWDMEKQAINLNGKFFRGQIPTLDISGNYYPSRELNNLDLLVNLDKFQLRVFQDYLKGYASNLRGVATGSISLKGEIEKPLLQGKLFIQKGGFLIDYLNTDYTFTNSIIIENNWFGFDNISVNDSKGNKCNATGTIRHNNFKDFSIDIALDAKNFMALNTTENLNPLYFGTSFITGKINIDGTVDNLTIDIVAKTEKGTSFYIPLYGTEEVTANNFISFVNKDSKNLKIKKERKIDLSGITLKFQLDVTPEAEVQLIFDPKIGDIIKGTGNGILNMEINTLGKFNIFGEYTIKEGDYLFTLMNVINKKFKVAQGGTINWNGDPYNANINLKAIYSLKTSLYELGIDTANNKKRYPINCLLNLQNDLMKPDISFGIDLPQSAEDTKTKVKELLKNEEEMNQQIFALLTINRFITPKSVQQNTSSYGNEAKSFGTNSTSEVLTNQLSNMLSQISDEFELDFKYRPQNDISNEEVQVALSTQQFNNRLSIDGSLSNIKAAGANNIVGDFNIEYKVSEDGRIRIKAFNRPNKNSLLVNNNNNQQGVGIFYRKEFNTFKDLFNLTLDKK